MKTDSGFAAAYQLNRWVSLEEAVICANLPEEIGCFRLIESISVSTLG
jgi:hypothetical protein